VAILKPQAAQYPLIPLTAPLFLSTRLQKADGATAQKALAGLDVVIQERIETAKELARPLREPIRVHDSRAVMMRLRPDKG
jgi:hypothetical protein